MTIIAEVISLLQRNQQNNTISISSIVSDLNTIGINLSADGVEQFLSADINTMMSDIVSWAAGKYNIVGYNELARFIANRYDGILIEDMNFKPRSIDNSMLEYGQCLTDMARKGRIGPVVGRDQEIDQCINILCRMKKRNPIIVGPSGSGKTTVAHGIAIRMANGKIPRKLYGKNIYTIDTSRLMEGTMMQGSMEAKINKLADRMNDSKDILFIDEIHTMMQNPMIDILGMLVNRLPNTSIIGTTTSDMYSRYVESSAGLERRFQKVTVDESDLEDTTKILMGVKNIYEDYHGIKVSDNIINMIPGLASMYSERVNPDASIELLDSVLAQSTNAGIMDNTSWMSDILDGRMAVPNILTPHIPNEITEDSVTKVISKMTGHEVITNDYQRINKLDEELKKRVIHQDSAIDEMTKFLRVSYVYHNPDKPLGSLLFLGTSGVGKSYLAKIVSEVMFSGKLLKLDMSEYSEKFTVSRLIGSPPGYVGYDEGGVLTNYVRRNPYCVVLFDEIEKAHPEVYNILLSIMDMGVLNDMRGRVAKFNNVLVILTSNIGTRHITEAKEFSIGFGGSKIDVDKEIGADVKKYFSPEFIDRLSGTVQFNKLVKMDMYRIIDLELDKLNNGPKISISDGAKDVILEDWKEGTGARQLLLLITRKILDEVSKMVVDGKLSKDGSVSVSTRDGKLKFKVK